MKKAIKSVKSVASVRSLPPGVEPADLKPASGRGEALSIDQRLELGLADHYCLTLYRTAGFGWVICTLAINGSRGRTYGMTMDGKVCRVGNGPHVLDQLCVYVKATNLKRLMPLIELLRKGLADAGTIRDRIGSRRAEGQLRRSRGEYSWRWSV